MKTELTDEYNNLLLKFTKDETQFQKCLDLIEKMTKNELEYAVSSTLWVWEYHENSRFYELLEAIFTRGGNPNAMIYSISIPPIFTATYRNDHNLIKFFIKWGADLSGQLVTTTGTFSIIEYIVYNCIWEGKPINEKMIQTLIKAGASTDISELPSKMSSYMNLDRYRGCLTEYKWIVKSHEQKKDYKEKIAELEADLKEAHDYIFELEHRPPELGGPEYEAGKIRWEARGYGETLSP